MATYLTGDIHGDVDSRFDKETLAEEGIRPTTDDVLVILGDAGVIWSTSAKKYPRLAARDERVIETLLEVWPGEVAFVDGNHENFATLAKLPQTERWGAPVGVVRERLYRLLRGEIYQLPATNGTASCFVMGGAYSVDKMWRVEGCDWWPEEIPSRAELAHGRKTLERAGWKVDYVLTHDCAPFMLHTLTFDSPFGHIDHRDRLTDFLGEVDGRTSFTHWYCGHYHVNRHAGEQHTCLYKVVVPLEEGLR